MSRVGREQRFTKSDPCPICGGYEAVPRGRGVRCHGFRSTDGRYVHCSRQEPAGPLQLEPGSSTYAHKLRGECGCGRRHDDGASVATPTVARRGSRSGSPIEETYDYCDAAGALLFQVVRHEGKRFRQRRPRTHDDEPAGLLAHKIAFDESWVWSLERMVRSEDPCATCGLLHRFEPIDRPLYRLPELLSTTGRVYVVEGEKDADRLTALGLVATTNAGGARKWPRAHAAAVLRGRHVVVLPDNDEPGRAHAEHVARSLRGTAASVKVLSLPNLPDKGGDVSDWLKAGGTPEALEGFAGSDARADGGPVLVRLARVEPESVTWLWPGRVPLGKLTVIDGDPGLGKSVLTLDLAARVSTGRAMPDGTRSDLPGPAGVVILSAEDGLADTIRPRLDAAGADAARVVALTGVRDHGDERLPTLADLSAIEDAVHEVAASLVVVDPLMAYLPGDVNSHRDQDVRRALAPLAALAERTGAAVVVVRHLRKAGEGKAVYRGGGSIGIGAAARSVLLVAADPDDDTRRVLASVKMNLCPAPPSLTFTLVPSGSTVRVEWGGESAHKADALLAQPATDEERNAVAEAADSLRTLLGNGPVKAEDTKRELKRLGISEWAWKRAKRLLRVSSRRIGFGAGSKVYWELPAMPGDKPSTVPYGGTGVVRAENAAPNPIEDGVGIEDGPGDGVATVPYGGTDAEPLNLDARPARGAPLPDTFTAAYDKLVAELESEGLPRAEAEQRAFAVLSDLSKVDNAVR